MRLTCVLMCAGERKLGVGQAALIFRRLWHLHVLAQLGGWLLGEAHVSVLLACACARCLPIWRETAALLQAHHTMIMHAEMPGNPLQPCSLHNVLSAAAMHGFACMCMGCSSAFFQVASITCCACRSRGSVISIGKPEPPRGLSQADAGPKDQ